MVSSGRRAKSTKELKRRPASRDVPDRVLIVTEGSRTEPDYFRMLINELGLTSAKVKIVGEGGAAPISVAREAERILNLDDDFEKIYCVFDRDCHVTYSEALRAIQGISIRKENKNKVILAITSIPCFEFWYLLHVSESRKPYNGVKSPADELISDLERYAVFKEYEKCSCTKFFDNISGQRSQAIERSKRFLQQAKDEGAQDFHENPSTRVHLVVESLIAIAKNKSMSGI